MKIRSVLFPCLVVFLAVATEFANVALATEKPGTGDNAMTGILAQASATLRHVAYLIHKPMPHSLLVPAQFFEDNCSPQNTLKAAWLCSANTIGTQGQHGGSFYTFGTFSNDQTGIISNIGKVTFAVSIEQFLRVDVPPQATLKPGESYNFGPYDRTTTFYSVLISDPVSTFGRPEDVKGWVQITPPSSSNRQCTDECKTNYDGCHQGCAFIGSGAFCLAGCDAAQGACLAHCPP